MSHRTRFPLLPLVLCACMACAISFWKGGATELALLPAFVDATARLKKREGVARRLGEETNSALGKPLAGVQANGTAADERMPLPANAKPSKAESVSVVIADDRPMRTFERPSNSSSDWASVFASTTRLWACRHNYSLRVVRPKGMVKHRRFGARNRVWFKIVALADALDRGFDKVLLLDVDAVIVRPQASLDDRIALSDASSARWQHYEPVRRGYASRLSSATTLASNASLVFGEEWNDRVRRLWGTNLNAGVCIARNTPEARDLLARWWNWNGQNGKFNRKYGYEQTALNRMLMEADEEKRLHVAKVSDGVINGYMGKMQVVRHYTSDLRGVHGWYQELQAMLERLLVWEPEMGVGGGQGREGAGTCPLLEASVVELDGARTEELLPAVL